MGWPAHIFSALAGMMSLLHSIPLGSDLVSPIPPGFLCLLARQLARSPSHLAPVIITPAGDMRYAPHLKSDPHLQRFVGADAVFLDTTYCNKRHTFPPQEESIAYVVAAVKRLLAGQAGEAEPDAPDGPEHADDSAAAPGADAPAPKTPAGPRRVILISTYGIGKERILSAVAATTGLRLAVTEKKLAVMRCLNLPGKRLGVPLYDFAGSCW